MVTWQATQGALWYCSLRRGPPSIWYSVLYIQLLEIVVACGGYEGMVVRTPRCNAIVDIFSPMHCWAGGPSPADVAHPTAGCGRWIGRGSGCGSGCV